ncbi:helix-turn-helix domain-containing protein [Lentilactobacillus senioris]|uniref:Xre-like DNA-binding protein n=1 Tax=Lentilactobacillus senioris DSM 24302 = JCM 17472 TaxID=1423802 RepID=A0A0R2CZV1_9LACO|nr:RodZ domain-containing protein [Lentilactobacillus senioris]KRM93673.1 Xre-like DNA-binding protein [Lentilactobacillus senioris DSM 24302 = JCM 17472]
MNDDKENVNKGSIGKTLRDARVAKGYTLDDLQKTTKIQKRYLIAIEDDDFDALPGEFYVRAFVKQYADSVDLNGNELLSEYKTKLPDTHSAEYVDRVNGDNPESRSAQRKVDERNSRIRHYIPIVAVSIVVLLILIAIWVAAARNTHDSSQTKIETSKVTVSSDSDKDKKASSTAAPKVNKTKKTTTKKVVKFKKTAASGSDLTYTVSGTANKAKVVKIKATESAWTSLSVNSTIKWQAAQTKGQVKKVTLPADTTQASINAGNATGIKIYVNGTRLKLAQPASGSSDQVRTITMNFK